MRRERLNILRRIAELDEERCDKCIDREMTICECRAAVKVRNLGDKLITLTRPRRREADDMLRALTFEDLTPEVYATLKREKVSDREIAKFCKVNPPEINRWKKRNNIYIKPNRKREKV